MTSTRPSGPSALVQARTDLQAERKVSAELLARAMDAEARLARGREAWREENAKVHVLQAQLAELLDTSDDVDLDVA